MSSATRSKPPDSQMLMIGIALTLITLIALPVYGAVQLVSRFTTGAFISGNQIAVITAPFRGQMTVTAAHYAVGGVILAVLMLTLMCAFIVMETRRARSEHVHSRAKHMGPSKHMSRKAAQRKIASGKLVSSATARSSGLIIARAVKDGRNLYTSWRDGVIAVMGPGAGKTTGLAIPLIMDAPGVVFGTSNKRDLVDSIRGAREQLGTVWVFDPQRIADYFNGQTPSWWWNPLSYVTDETRANSLAKLFATNEREEGTKSDPFFDKEGPHLLARLMLAAAVDGRYLPQVFLWLSDAKDRTPVRLLQDRGYAMSAAALQAAYNWPDEQRQGVFATAQSAVEFLDNQAAQLWISPLPGVEYDTRIQFSPEAFVRSSGDTLMSLSKEGDGSYGPITAALTKAVLDAAEEYAARECGGRMPIPMVGMLDEAANCCRMPDLPKKYSFYGSYGIFLVTILQNWSQGVAAWGENGTRQLWAAATHRIVGAGAEDMDFLKRVSERIGNHDVRKWNSSSSGNGRGGSSSSVSSEPIMSPADLAEMPFGTAVVMPSGGPAVMARSVPFWERSDIVAAAVNDSVAHYGKQGPA